MEHQEIQICWEAADPARNLARTYRVSVTTDLFGWIVVERAWGRRGSRQRTIRESCATQEQAIAIVQRVCRRRAGAARRIGAAYRII